MADEKKKKESWIRRFANWWVRLFHTVVNAFKNMWYELKKVTWPTKQKWKTYSLIVLAFMLFMSIVIGLLDTGASALIRLLV